MANISRVNNTCFSQLPNEVLLQILSYSPKLWLKDIRLVNRIFATLGASYLFDTAVFSPHKVDIADYLSIANHPVFCHYVKTVVYSAVRVKDVMNFDEYKELVFRDPNVMKRSKKALRAAYTKTRAMQKEEQQLWESGQALASMCMGLTKFSYLYHVEIADTWESTVLPGERRTSRGPGRLCRQWSVDISNPKVYLSGESPSSRGMNQKQTFPLFALSLSQRSVLEITSHRKPWWVLSEDCVDALHNHSSLINPLLEHLRILRVHFAWNRGRGRWARVRKVLGAARALEELSLGLNSWGTRFFPFHIVVRENTWPRLRSLLISQAKVSEIALITLLASYAPTLRRFEMSLTCLTKGRWVTVVTRIRRILRLQECKLTVRLNRFGKIINRLRRIDPYEEELDLGGYVIHGGEIPHRLIGPEMNA